MQFRKWTETCAHSCIFTNWRTSLAGLIVIGLSVAEFLGYGAECAKADIPHHFFTGVGLLFARDALPLLRRE